MEEGTMDRFATTQSGLIARAREGEPDALGELCRAYWRPVYVFYRARGCAPADAEELTQQLFASLMAPRELAAFDPARGRFRCWLQGAAQHLMLNDLKRERARKRGGGWARLDLDVGAAEQTFQMEAPRGRGADQMFDRCWAETVTARVLARVRADCEQEGKGAAYARLAAFVLDEEEGLPPADERSPERSIVALRVERHRLKERLRGRCLRYLREEIAMTVGDPHAIDDEIRVLFDASD